MQTVINFALRFIHCNEQDLLNTEELHTKFNITPLSTSNHYKAQRVWETIKLNENELYDKLSASRNYTPNWFPESSSIIGMNHPRQS